MNSSHALLTTALVSALASTGSAQVLNRGTGSIPSVVITIENAQRGNSTFLTPPWIAVHDGTFDTYDGGSPANVPLGGNEIESLAEDGNNGPITAAFAAMLPNAPQVEGLAGPTGPLGPGSRASVTLNVNPMSDRYFSYASMVIPSNDAFIANGNPLAHELFNERGEFVARDFVVSGDESNDAGTEVNDEVPANVAFLNQSAPNTGVTETGVVTTPSPGFAAPGTLAFPSGVLNHPAFGGGDFNDADDRLLSVRFRYVDFGGIVPFEANLSTDQEVQPSEVISEARGAAMLRSRFGSFLGLLANVQDLTGPIQMAHLHLGQAGSNGPVVVDLGAGVMGDTIRMGITAADLTGPLKGADFQAFLNEVAAGNVYVNIHTEMFPAGELRGQVLLAD